MLPSPQSFSQDLLKIEKLARFENVDEVPKGCGKIERKYLENSINLIGIVCSKLGVICVGPRLPWMITSREQLKAQNRFSISWRGFAQNANIADNNKQNLAWNENSRRKFSQLFPDGECPHPDQ